MARAGCPRYATQHQASSKLSKQSGLQAPRETPRGLGGTEKKNQDVSKDMARLAGRLERAGKKEGKTW